MSSSASDSAQPTSAASTGTQNISNVLGSISQSSTNSASATQSSASSASSSSSASSASSGSSSASKTSAAGSNTITNAPQLSTASSVSITSLSNAPSLTSGNAPKLTDLPPLSGYYSYPPPTVPPMQNAPYLQKTNVPENFVFIVVGATIAFVALIIIAWRVFTSWSINRGFQRHEGGFAGHRGKAAYTPLADIKQKPQAASSHDMKDLGNLPRNFSTVPSLFFSPTAEVARHSMRPPSSRAESRQHLPAGHYRDASDGGR